VTKTHFLCEPLKMATFKATVNASYI